MLVCCSNCESVIELSFIDIVLVQFPWHMKKIGADWSTNFWSICVTCHPCNHLCSTVCLSCMTKTYIGHYVQTLEPIFVTPALLMAPLISAILYHFHWPWLQLGSQKVSTKSTLWLHFLAHFSTDQDEIWRGIEAVFKLTTPRLLLRCMLHSNIKSRTNFFRPCLMTDTDISLSGLVFIEGHSQKAKSSALISINLDENLYAAMTS